MNENVVNLQEAVRIRRAMETYRDQKYINLMQQMKEKCKEIMKDDLGSQFVQNCGRDIAGEVVRNYFDTSDYHITVDQLALRILKFKYDDEYDPLGKNEEIRKNVYNYNDIESSTLDSINGDLDSSSKQLFELDRKSDYSDSRARKVYREGRRDENGNIYDDLTGVQGENRTVIKNGKEVFVSDLHADHIQSREAFQYQSKFIKEQGIQELKDFVNSAENMQLMHASANTSKGDIRVCSVGGKTVYMNARSKDYDPKTDITSRATPEQLTEATCRQWEKSGEPEKTQMLKDKGYLDEDGKVPKSVRKKLEDNIRASQNAESRVILKNADLKSVGKKSTDSVKKGMGKIIAGQVIYYAAPPIVYEVRCILKDRKITCDNAVEQLKNACGRICDYVFSHLKDIFANVIGNSLKKFIKSFMDILIGMVKATIQKLLKVVKSMALAVVDAVRIIATPGSSAAQKADAVFNLFGVTVTNIAVEILFEIIQKNVPIPDILLGPLQILTSVICTNFTILILQKADLFDVRYGFKIEAMRKAFAEEREKYIHDMELAEKYTDYVVEKITAEAKEESMKIYSELMSMDTKRQSVRENLEKVNTMFNIDIDFNAEWMKYLGLEDAIPMLT